MTSKKSLLFLFLLMGSIQLFSQNQYWKKTDENRIPSVTKLERQIIPQKYVVHELNFEMMKQILAEAPMRFSAEAASKNVVISLPLPDGGFQQFRIEEAPTMHPTLQAQYPNIRSYAGYGLNDRTTYMRCEFSPEGFSAMILATGKTYFVDPFSKGNTQYCISYDKKDFSTDKKMNCLVTETLGDTPYLGDDERTGDGKLRNYRLALACTGEYATYCGGTVAKVLAAMNKTMTRVNGVYEKEHSITMTMVANNNLLVYLTASTDPYTNNNGSTMLGQNQTNVDNIIGTSNYDIGHVFSTGGGGIANLQSPCKSGSKAKGVTGLPAPVNDPFDIDYVCHEMGHQYGGEHTFNNSCGGNISTSSSYETGSGSTIMGYAGVCAPNVQNNSDAYFHLQSLIQINAYTVNSTGNTCPTKISTNNNAQPVVNAGLDYIIPKSTPFELTGSATDADNDPLTYCWEQWDKESATQAPKSTNTVGPTFRSYYPNDNPTRIFPNITNIVKNTANTWEVLPSVARTMNFRLTARDLHNGFGRTNADGMIVTVNATAGPFLVTAPNTAVKWEILSKQTVTWNVAGTFDAPINCTNVNILLSTDGGYNFTDTLAANVPNTGSYEITVPNKVTTTARIKVKGANNVFFDMSNADFTISLPAVPTFTMASTTSIANVCKEKTDSAVFNLNLTSLVGFKEKLKLTALNLPANAKVSFSQDTITPTGTVQVVFYDLKKIANGIFPIKIKAQGTSKKDSINLTISAFAGTPSITNGISPIDYKGANLGADKLKWNSITNASSYIVEISQDYLFSTIDETATVADTTYLPTKLVYKTVYFWRIRASNHCTNGDNSATYAFQTSDKICNTFNGVGLPVAIPTNALFDQKIDAVVLGSGNIFDLEVNANISHTFVSNLILTLESPSGKTAELINGQCTSADNIVATFSDAGTTLVCANAPAVAGTVKPKNALSTFKGSGSNGVWKLRVQDTDASGSGGTINSWSLKVCSELPVQVPITLTKNPFSLIEGTYKSINGQFLVASSPNVVPGDITYLITKLPTQGTLRKGSTPLQLGAKVTQLEVNAGLLLYYNNIGSSALDSFQCLVSTVNFGWLPTQTFKINVLTGSSLLTVTATQTQAIACHNDKNGEIGIDVIGGQKPYKYSIDGGVNYQDTSYFSNLAAGKYFPAVKDAQGLIKKVDSLVIKNPELLKITTIVDSNNVFLSISGGTKPYSINFNNNGFGKVDSFFQLSNGKYLIVVKDANDCTSMDSVTLAVNTLVLNPAISKNILCYNGKNGEIAVDVKGGKLPFQYQLNNGTFQSSNTFSGLGAGTYTVTVKDAENFTRTTGTIILTNPSEITAQITVVNDSIFAVGAGGTGALQYSVGTTFNSNNSFTGLPNGITNLSIKDQNGCTTVFKVTIDALVIKITDFKGISCNGEKDATITIDGSGGKKPYTYSIDNGVTYQSSGTFTGLGNATYNLTAKDSTGFVRKLIYKVSDPAVLAATVTKNANSVTINATGGTTPYKYSQDGGPQNQTSNVFNNLNGNYTFTIVDANGCKTTVAANAVTTTDLGEKLGISIAPNPTSDNVQIAFSNTFDKNIHLQLFDMQGRMLLKNEILANTSVQNISLANIPNGIYQLLLRSEEKTFVTKIVVVH